MPGLPGRASTKADVSSGMFQWCVSFPVSPFQGRALFCGNRGYWHPVGGFDCSLVSGRSITPAERAADGRRESAATKVPLCGENPTANSNSLLANKQFDRARTGNSTGGTIDFVPL